MWQDFRHVAGIQPKGRKMMMNSEQVDERVAQLIEELYRLYKDYHTYVYSESIANELKAIGEPALKPLTRALDEANAEVRQTAVYALGKIGEPALGALSHALDDADANVRKQALDELDNIGEPALEALTRALDDADAEVRRRAVNALDDIGEPALEALGHALEDEDKDVRWYTIEVLTRIGKPAVHLLAVALEDPEGWYSDGVVRYLSGQDSALFGYGDIEAHHDVAEAIIDELIIRSSGRSSEYFNSKVVTKALQGTISRNPRLRLAAMREGEPPQVGCRGQLVATPGFAVKSRGNCATWLINTTKRYVNGQWPSPEDWARMNLRH